MFFFPEKPKHLEISLQKTKFASEELRNILICGCKENLTLVRNCNFSKEIHQGQHIEIIYICNGLIQQQKIGSEWRRQVHLEKHRDYQSCSLPSAHMVDGDLFSIAKSDQLPILIHIQLRELLRGMKSQKDPADPFDILGDKHICIAVRRLETVQFISQFTATVQFCLDIVNFSLVRLFFGLVFRRYDDLTRLSMEIFAKGTDIRPVQSRIRRCSSYGIPKGNVSLQSRGIHLKMFKPLFCLTLTLPDLLQFFLKLFPLGLLL